MARFVRASSLSTATIRSGRVRIHLSATAQRTQSDHVLNFQPMRLGFLGQGVAVFPSAARSAIPLCRRACRTRARANSRARQDRAIFSVTKRSTSKTNARRGEESDLGDSKLRSAVQFV